MDNPWTACQVGSVETPPSDWHTMQAGRTWDLKVSFDPPYNQPPTLVPIFKMLDVGNSAAFRAFTKISRVDDHGCTIKVGTCGDTKMFAATVAWMAIPSTNFDLQTGITSVPPGGVNRRITFPRQFRSQPLVFYTISAVDVSNLWCVDLAVHTITTDGFDIEVHSWGSGELQSAGVTWIALPGDLPEIGLYTVHPVGEHKGSSGYIPFRQKFVSKPQVFIGLNKMDIDHRTTGRFRFEVCNLTNKGMEWQIITWANTSLNELRVTFLVIGNLP